MACGANDALVVPALPGAEVVGCIAGIRHVFACLLDKRWGTGLNRFGDPEAAVRIARGRAAVALRLVHARVPVQCRRYRELTSGGAAAARLAGVDVSPRHAVVGRPPDAHVVGGRVDHARVGWIYCESRCAARRPEARWERLAGLRAEDDIAGLG